MSSILPKTCSVDNKENSCARLNTVIVLIQYDTQWDEQYKGNLLLVFFRTEVPCYVVLLMNLWAK